MVGAMTSARSTEPDDRRAAERARLDGYIADSLRRRRRLSLALTPVALAALAVTFADRTIGLIALTISVSTIGIGLYITTAHVTEWRARLRELAPPGGRRGAGRGG